MFSDLYIFKKSEMEILEKKKKKVNESTFYLFINLFLYKKISMRIHGENTFKLLPTNKLCLCLSYSNVISF